MHFSLYTHWSAAGILLALEHFQWTILWTWIREYNWSSACDRCRTARKAHTACQALVIGLNEADDIELALYFALETWGFSMILKSREELQGDLVGLLAWCDWWTHTSLLGREGGISWIVPRLLFLDWCSWLLFRLLFSIANSCSRYSGLLSPTVIPKVKKTMVFVGKPWQRKFLRTFLSTNWLKSTRSICGTRLSLFKWTFLLRTSSTVCLTSFSLGVFGIFH